MNLVIDTHTHTVSSGHAYSTVQENAREAAANGIKIFVMADHGPALPGASSLLHFGNLRIIPEEIYGVRVVKGVEANILDREGRLDMPESYLTRLEFVLASFHDVTFDPINREEHTSILEKVLKNPYVDAVAHPGNPMYPVDIDRVVRAAAEYGKFIEINNTSFKVRKGCEANCMEFVKKCKKYGVTVTCGSDAHISFDVGRFDRVNAMLEEAGMPEELVLCTSVERFENYLAERKKFKKKIGRPQ
jgi:putative hydrolase